jgi:Short C-terminal domain
VLSPTNPEAFPQSQACTSAIGTRKALAFGAGGGLAALGAVVTLLFASGTPAPKGTTGMGRSVDSDQATLGGSPVHAVQATNWVEPNPSPLNEAGIDPPETAETDAGRERTLLAEPASFPVASQPDEDLASIVTALERLADLRDRGAISDVEYETLKSSWVAP